MAGKVYFFIFWSFFIVSTSRCVALYIVPSSISLNDSVLCPSNVSCVTFQQYADGWHKNATELIFLPGNHSVHSDISVSNISTLLLSSYRHNPFSATINCNFIAKFQFFVANSIEINDLKIVNCISNVFYLVSNATLRNCIFMADRMPEKMYGAALLIIKTNVYAQRVLFSSFQGVKWQMHTKVHQRQNSSVRSGGALVISSISNGSFVECEFFENSAIVGGAIFIEHDSIVNFRKSIFSQNIVNCSEYSCGYGGVIFANSRSKIFVSNCQFLDNEVIPVESGNEGGVFALYDSMAVIYFSEFMNNSASFAGGVFSCESSLINITRSSFNNHYAVRGGVLHTEDCTVYIVRSTFSKNTAYLGGVIYDATSIYMISFSTFGNNLVLAPGGSGGIISATESLISIGDNSYFFNNSADINGGVVVVSESDVTISESSFIKNFAFISGGVFKIYDYSTMKVTRCSFTKNQAGRDGGVLYGYSSDFLFKECDFNNNTATDNGGALFLSDCKTIFSSVINFKGNAAYSGGTVYNVYGSLQSNGSVTINNSMTCVAVMYILHSTANFLGSLINNENFGSLFIFNSRVEISGKLECLNNKVILLSRLSNSCSRRPGFQEGGGLTAILSRIDINGSVTIENNNASRGGGLMAVATRLYFSVKMRIRKNTANISGGGLYLYQCQVHFSGKFVLESNLAITMGGGIHSISSSIVFFGTEKPGSEKKLKSKINIISNNAKIGGGISLEFGSKVYAIADYKLIIFSKNKAIKGGAIHVADETNSGSCPSESKIVSNFAVECFFQWISPSIKINRKQSVTIIQVLSFSYNKAKTSGGILHGGLLDRCTISPFHKYYNIFFSINNINSGVFFFKQNGKIKNLKDISSEPVRICFCNKNNHYDCNYVPSAIHVKRGERFNLTLVSVDQVNHTIKANVRISVTSGRMEEDQQVQTTYRYCTPLGIQVFSPLPKVILQLYPEGPCNSTGISQRQLDIIFLPCTCAIGFQPSKAKKSECVCECDAELFPYVTSCNSDTYSFVRASKFWIGYIYHSGNSSKKEGYLLYPNCPFDYCHPPNDAVNINLNKPNGADIQCAFNRSKLLCSVCQSGYSLSLGSSKCIICPRYWPALFTVILLATAIAGIILVSFILILDLTVATGYLNGLIFYANIVAANRSVFIPFGKTTFHSVFIDWMNLSFGFDTCFFDGMDSYTKVWLQIGFSFYLIIIVILVIFVSERSTKFARLIGRRNPIATLSTLILLSYTNLLQSIISILSFGVLTYPDGSREFVWLPDASVHYLKGKHIPLFLASLCIIMLVIVYTFLLFSWQWLLKLPYKNYFRWIWNTRISSFMDAYHAPYCLQNRYWTGLLLLLRALIYLVVSLNVSGEPSINTLVVTLSMCFLLLLVTFLRQPIYKKLSNNVLELTCYFHIIALGIAKYHVLEVKHGGTALAYTSVSIAFATFLGILIYSIIKLVISVLNVKNAKSKANNDLQVPFLENDNIFSSPLVTHSEVAIEKENSS